MKTKAKSKEIDVDKLISLDFMNVLEVLKCGTDARFLKKIRWGMLRDQKTLVGIIVGISCIGGGSEDRDLTQKDMFEELGYRKLSLDDPISLLSHATLQFCVNNIVQEGLVAG